MHFPVIINVRKDSRKSNPERHGAESDGFWIIRNDGRGDIAERNGQCRNAKNAVRHLPCVFVLNCPWQTKSRMPVERQPGEIIPEKIMMMATTAVAKTFSPLADRVTMPDSVSAVAEITTRIIPILKNVVIVSDRIYISSVVTLVNSARFL